MSKKKIFNDPIYGFIKFPFDILYDLIEHPYFQRLRRITQQGMSHLVYPGAMHTRFHHALGALHLTCKAIEELRSKGNDITDKEYEGTCIAILLHDIGHGPYSHALEHTLVPYHHERMSLAIMRQLNDEYNGALTTGISIFEGKHEKKFLHQLVSSQLDMDRLDYLTRDSFFTGVAEGTVSYDRIITMLNVKDNSIVVEEKGIYSIEKFLIARRFMYWQVYLHKTGIAAEQMLISFMKRLKEIYLCDQSAPMSSQLRKVLSIAKNPKNNISLNEIKQFCLLDDSDIIYTLKLQLDSFDKILSFLAKSILNRKLFKVFLQNEPITAETIEIEKNRIKDIGFHSSEAAEYLVLTGNETNQTYNKDKEKIMILMKSGEIFPLDQISDNGISSNSIAKYYICSPKT